MPANIRSIDPGPVRPFSSRIQPAPRDGGFAMEDFWIWCGSVVRGEDRRYHMFASRWPKAYPFYSGYLYFSEIVRAVADRPAGPYQFQEVVLPARGTQFWDGQMTHNPVVVRQGDQYLLFHIGTTFSGPKPTPAELRQEPSGGRAANVPSIGLATARSVFGPWQRRDQPILTPRPDHWDHSVITNPAPCVLANGRIFMLYRSYGAQIGAACAAGPDVPFVRLGEAPVVPFSGPNRIEDMCVWQTGDRFEMLAKDLTPDGALCGEIHAGLHAFSDDGLTWTLAKPAKAYSRQVLWADGATTIQGCLERPQILIEDGQPTHLFAATGDGPGGFNHCTKTWNMAIPLRGACKTSRDMGLLPMQHGLEARGTIANPASCKRPLR
ncbi:MAG: glycoside hydrolase family protein [Candidatus Marinimicrobia bacterium]|nr:glycoside hydrolase family protein [Candidatus Neomarinimicrobiota bacterium]